MSDRSTAREKKVALTKEQEEDARRLREFDAFAKFSEDDMKRVVRAAHRTSTSGPWPLIREQTVSDACYILLSGEAGVYVGRDRIAVLGPGEVIGESALKRGKLRNATVTTTGRAEVLHIDRNDLDRLLDELPALREVIDATVARRVPGGATADRADVWTGSVRARCARGRVGHALCQRRRSTSAPVASRGRFWCRNQSQCPRAPG